MALLLKNILKLSKPFIKVDLLQGHQFLLKNLQTASVVFSPSKQYSVAKHPIETSKPNKKQKDSPKITLLQNGNMTVSALEDAKHLAKRRSLHLVKVQDIDPKTQRPVYKLLTAAEMLENELSETKKPTNAALKKAEKTLSIGSRIGEHDLTARLKNISKWLNKQHEVKVLIQATSEQDLANAEKIFKSMEEHIKNPQTIGKIVQKRTKSNMIKFSILPLAPVTESKPGGNSQ